MTVEDVQDVCFHNFIQDVYDVCAFITLIGDINTMYIILAVPMAATAAPVAASSASSAVPSTSTVTAEFIDEMGESHPVEVFHPIDIPDAEEEVTVEHSYSALSPPSASTTQPSSRPASGPSSRPSSRPPSRYSASHPHIRRRSATRRSAARGDEQELLFNMLQVQTEIRDHLENVVLSLEETAASLQSIAISMQQIASQRPQSSSH